MLKFRPLLLITLLCAIVSHASFAANPAEERKEYEAQLKKLEDDIKNSESQLSLFSSKRTRLERQLRNAETAIARTLKDISILNSRIAYEREQLQTLQDQRSEIQANLRSKKDEIAAYVRAAYRQGDHSQLKLLLNQQSPQDIQRINTYYKYVSDAQLERAQTYLNAIEELNALEPQIAEREKSLNNQHLTLQKEQSDLEANQQERAQTLALLEQQIADQNSQLKQQVNDRERLQELLNDVIALIAQREAMQNGESFAKRKGQMTYPTKGKIVHSFGRSKLAGKLSWEGMLIEAPMGSDVRAIHSGQVVFADYLRGHGLLIIVDHGGGYMSLYAHNQSLLKETGAMVAAGDVIARVGNSGGLDNTALYFEIRHQGKPTDPSLWCHKG